MDVAPVTRGLVSAGEIGPDEQEKQGVGGGLFVCLCEEGWCVHLCVRGDGAYTSASKDPLRPCNPTSLLLLNEVAHLHTPATVGENRSFHLEPPSQNPGASSVVVVVL